MPGNLYLSAAEFPAYGLADSTDPALVRVARDLVDSFCRRASILIAQYEERTKLPDGRPVTRASFTPLIAAEGNESPFLSLRARHGLPRGSGSDAVLGAMLAPFGGPPAWVELDPAAVDFHRDTGEIWLPAGLYGAPYTEVEMTYTAGYAEPPENVKLACAQIIRNIESHPAPNVRSAQLDRLQLEYFAGSLLDEDTRRLLAPFIALRLN
jgi:hypothetical protein